MKPGFFAPRGTLANKPAHGAPCNRCGLCCMASLCPLGAAVFRGAHGNAPKQFHEGPCPALEQVDGAFACGLIAHPGRYSPARTLAQGDERMREAAMLLIGSGDGCDTRVNGEPRNEAFAHDLDRKAAARTKRSRKAQSVWGFENLKWASL